MPDSDGSSRDQAAALGAAIRAWRLHRGLSERELARRMYLSDPSVIVELECGRTVACDATLGSVARGLGVPLEDLQETRTPDSAQIARDAQLFRDILRQSQPAAPAGAPVIPVHEAQITGTERVMDTAIHLLESAPPLTEPHSNQILVTWRGEASLIDEVGDAQMRGRWVCAFRTALERGWDIIHLVRLGDHPRKASLVALNILSLLGTPGLYAPRLLPREPHTRLDLYDFVLVPGHGGLELRGLDTAVFYSPPGAQLSDLWAKVSEMREASERIYSFYPRLSPDFAEAIAWTDELDGDRWLVMNGLSESTVPLRVHQGRARGVIKRGGMTATRAQELLNSRERREKAIKRQLETWHLRDVCPKRAIDRLVQSGIFSDDDSLLRLGAPALTKPQRKLHLAALINRLDQYENYQLILLDDDDAAICRTFYMAKTGHVVLLEFWRPDAYGGREQVDIKITDPLLVRAFCENPVLYPYFNATADYRSEVKRFLEAQRDRL